jgi:nucleolar protein 4
MAVKGKSGGGGRGGGDRRVTPALERKKANMKRSRHQLKAKRSANKPSWSEALRRRYIEQDQKSQGKHIDERPWQRRITDAKKQRELQQVRRRRGSAAGDEEDGNAAGADDDDEEHAEGADEQFDFGDKEATTENAVEVQEEVDEEKMNRLNERQPLQKQLFLKGLPQDVDADDLSAHLGRFGQVRKVFVVRHKLTGMPTGSAFVHFDEEEGARELLEHAQLNSKELSTDMRTDEKDAATGLSRHKAKELLYKLKHQQTVFKDPFIHYGQTRVSVLTPMSRTDAEEFIGAMHKGGKKAKRTPVGADDPRNLYLLREGFVEAGTPAAKGLPVHHLQALLRDFEERKHQLKNVNFFVSKTRLSIRNLPRDFDSAKLRKIILEKAKDFYKANPTLKDKSKWGKHGPIKQCRVLVDARGQSKRFGFAELCDHDVALYCLRMVNNNPDLFGPNNRPVVAFAVENYNALQKMARLRDLRKERDQHAEAERQSFLDMRKNGGFGVPAGGSSGGGGAEGEGGHQSYRAMAMATRNQIQSRPRSYDAGGKRRSKPQGGRFGIKKAGGGGGKAGKKGGQRR